MKRELPSVSNRPVTSRGAVYRTGPVGRLARLVLAAAFAYPLLSIVGPGGSSRFRNPHILSEPSAWLLHILMLVTFIILVGALAAALAGERARRPWQLGALVTATALVAIAGGIGLVDRGLFWGFPLADLVWWFDVLMLIEQIGATLLAVGIGTPGCEVGVWPYLIGRARGAAPSAENGLACIVGLHLIDGWEARRAQVVNQGS
jgi:hypothetical protein